MMENKERNWAGGEDLEVQNRGNTMKNNAAMIPVAMALIGFQKNPDAAVDQSQVNAPSASFISRRRI